MNGKSAEELRARMRGVTERFGPWQSHNIYIDQGVFTIRDQPITTNYKLRNVMQLSSDLLQGRFEGVRVLDLACEEGMFAIEFARRGAAAIGVEGREVHAERARFVKRELGLTNCEFVQGDVREITPESHGRFDVVLCLGILYHLDAPDVMKLVHRLRRLTRRFMIVQTQVALRPTRHENYEGATYSGTPVLEHPPRAEEQEKRARLRASLDNPEAFWLTKPSLFNLLLDAGFSSVLEARHPRPAVRFADRVLLAAHAGEPVELHSAPGLNGAPTARWPERERLRFNPNLTRRGRVRRWLSAHGVNRC